MGRVVVFLSMLTVGCIHNAVQTQLAQPEKITYDTRGLLRLIHNWGFAQGCPVGPTKILTARHVGFREEGQSVPAGIAGIWSTPEGATGNWHSIDYDYRRDVAILESDRPLPHVYTIAERAPLVGDPVFVAGYEFRAGKDPFGIRTLETKVINIVSAHLVLAESGVPGFSGSCVLNFRSEVVGIFHWGVATEDAELGLSSLVTGEWGNVSWVPTKPQVPPIPSRDLSACVGCGSEHP